MFGCFREANAKISKQLSRLVDCPARYFGLALSFPDRRITNFLQKVIDKNANFRGQDV